MAVLNIDLDDLIPPTFRWVDNQLLHCNADEIIKKGGRNTGKSQTTTEMILIGCMIYKESAVALVKYANMIKERLVSVFMASIKFMHLEQYWKLRHSPSELVLLDETGRETDVSIKFLGCDDPTKFKSYKSRSGSGFRYIWFEEATNFSGRSEINSLIESFGRLESSIVIFTYNPPMSTSSWVNQEFEKPEHVIYDKNNIKITEEIFDGEISRKIIHHSTYLDLYDCGYKHWFSKIMRNNIARAKESNPKYYRWNFLGEVVGTDANVFNNIYTWDGDISNLRINEVNRGFDWGYGGADTCAYTEVFYDRVNHDLYILDEFGRPKMDIPDIVGELVKHNKHNFPIYGDSGVPLLNTQLNNRNINILGVKKGKDSVRAGITWLQSLNHIYICATKTPKHFIEFTGYEYILDRDGNITAELPDKNNHFIDSVRYALSVIIRTSNYNTINIIKH